MSDLFNLQQPGDSDNDKPPHPPNVTVVAKPCRACGSCLVALSWRPYAPGKRHIRVSCVGCSRWREWALQTPINVALANAAASAV